MDMTLPQVENSTKNGMFGVSLAAELQITGNIKFFGHQILEAKLTLCENDRETAFHCYLLKILLSIWEVCSAL